MPFICGSSQEPGDLCWAYNAETDSWNPLSLMEDQWYQTANAFDAEWGLVMAGGRNSSGATEKVRQTRDGQTFVDLPDLPTAISTSYYACLAILDSERLFYTYSNDAFLYDASTGMWNQVAYASS